MNWPWSKRTEPSQRERIENLELILDELLQHRQAEARAASESQEFDDVSVKITCLNLAIGTLVSGDSMMRIASKDIVEYADSYYKYMMKNVPISNNK